MADKASPNNNSPSSGRGVWLVFGGIALVLLLCAIGTLGSYDGSCQGMSGGPISCSLLQHIVQTAFNWAILAMIMVFLAFTTPVGWIILGVIIVGAVALVWSKSTTKKAQVNSTSSDVTTESIEEKPHGE